MFTKNTSNASIQDHFRLSKKEKKQYEIESVDRAINKQLKKIVLTINFIGIFIFLYWISFDKKKYHRMQKAFVSFIHQNKNLSMEYSAVEFLQKIFCKILIPVFSFYQNNQTIDFQLLKKIKQETEKIKKQENMYAFLYNNDILLFTIFRLDALLAQIPFLTETIKKNFVLVLIVLKSIFLCIMQSLFKPYFFYQKITRSRFYPLISFLSADHFVAFELFNEPISLAIAATTHKKNKELFYAIMKKIVEKFLFSETVYDLFMLILKTIKKPSLKRMKKIGYEVLSMILL